jgi:molybdopterin converting factor small subunit
MVTDRGTAHVKMFGVLMSLRRREGLPTDLRVDLPAEGVSARALAQLLGLPVETIEGVFVNHVIHDLSHQVVPGDEVAFVPHGTPGPHRFFLGLYDAGRAEGRGEE